MVEIYLQVEIPCIKYALHIQGKEIFVYIYTAQKCSILYEALPMLNPRNINGKWAQGISETHVHS